MKNHKLEYTYTVLHLLYNVALDPMVLVYYKFYKSTFHFHIYLFTYLIAVFFLNS